jgi:prolyl oligopeptidase
LKAENDYARASLDALPLRKQLLEELRRLDSSLDTFPAALNPVGQKLFYMRTPPPADVFQLFMRDGKDGREHLLFDPQKLSAAAGTHCSLDLFHVAPDGRHVVCRISRGGSEKTALQVVSTATGESVGQLIERTSGNVYWHPHGRAFFYSRSSLPEKGASATPPSSRQRVYLHSLDGNADNDRPVFGFGVWTNVPMTERQSGSIHTSWDSDFMVGVVRDGVGRHCEIHLAPLSSLEKSEISWSKVCGFEDEVFGYALQRNSLLLSSHQNAPRGKLLRVPCESPDLARAELVVPENSTVLGQVAVAKDGIYLVVGNGIAHRLFRVRPGMPAQPEELTLPVVGSIDRLIHDPRQAGVILPLVSWTEPMAYYAFDPTLLKFAKLKLDPAEAPDLIPLQAERVKVRSKDGTLVPLTIVSRKGLERDGRRPTLLNGYGAYGIAQTPTFDLSRNPWFAAGGVYAVAHVRGGGELGEEWRLAGKGLNKQNGIEDFVSCAEYLVAQGYTSPAKLAAKSASAGGVLVGRALTRRPELFSAVIIEVGALDALRFEVTPNGPPNIPEWGSVETREGFEALRAMSPYEHVTAGTAYPAVLLTTGINDPRVEPWQPAKMAARLRAATTSSRPILLAVNYDEGHFHTTLSSFNEHHADTWAFLLWQLGETKQ